MPGGDGTGPYGLGPGTGRGRGFCLGYPGPGFLSSGFGRGFGRGGWRNWQMMSGNSFMPGYPGNFGFKVISPVDELEYLKAEKEALERQHSNLKNVIDDISKKIDALEHRNDSKSADE